MQTLILKEYFFLPETTVIVPRLTDSILPTFPFLLPFPQEKKDKPAVFEAELMILVLDYSSIG